MKIVNLNNLNTHYEIKNLIIGHFNIIHNGHLKLINKHKNFSFLIFLVLNPSRTTSIWILMDILLDLHFSNFDLREKFLFPSQDHFHPFHNLDSK